MKRNLISAAIGIFLSFACIICLIACSNNNSDKTDTTNDVSTSIEIESLEITTADDVYSDEESGENLPDNTDSGEETADITTESEIPSDVTSDIITDTDSYEEPSVSESDTTDFTESEPTTETETETETETIIDPPLSLEEWKKAFDFSAFDSFTITYTKKSYIAKTVGHETTISDLYLSGIIQYQNGKILTKLNQQIEETVYPELTAIGPLSLTSLLDVDNFIDISYDDYYSFNMGRVIDYLIASQEDYGFSDFTYFEDKNCYINDIYQDQSLIRTEVYLENGVLTRIKLSEDDNFIDMILININTTEITAPITDEALEAAISSAGENLLSAASAKFAGKVEMSVGTWPFEAEKELSDVVDVFNDTVAKNIISVTLFDDKLISVSFDAKDSQIDMGTLFSPIVYDTIKFYFDDNGRLINIVYTENCRYEIEY